MMQKQMKMKLNLISHLIFNDIQIGGEHEDGYKDEY